MISRFSGLPHVEENIPVMKFPMTCRLGFIAIAILWGFPSLAAAKPPNVLMILADDLGYADLQCRGSSDMRTPHIDALFARGMTFDNFYANCSVCSPTRAALLTGRYPDLVGVPGVIRTHPENSWGYLRPDCVLLPQVFKDAGYRTAIVGKWHLGLQSPNTPNDRGFDHFHGFLGDMMDDYTTHRRHGINYLRLNREEIDPSGHATDLFTTWACDFLEQQSNDQPFFLYLAYNAPHTPIQPPAEFLKRVRDRDPQMSEQRSKLVALIEHLDAGVGRVIEKLQQRHLDRDTIVVFTSDNGGQLEVGANNGPLRDGKQSMYEGGLKVPAAIVWPANISAGSRSDLSVMTMDLFPTLLEACAIKFEHEIDGRSFLPILRGEQQPPLRDLWFFSRREGGAQYGGKTIDAVRRGDWKLLQNSPFQPLELYNLREDPREQHNRIATEPKIANELSTALRLQIQRAGAVPWQPPSQ